VGEYRVVEKEQYSKKSEIDNIERNSSKGKKKGG
jgi:hypothetical protein